MTAHALLVLSLALVCSPAGFTSGQTSDRASEHTTHTYVAHAHTDTHHTMKTRTNIHTQLRSNVHNNIDKGSNNYKEFYNKRELANDNAGFDEAFNKIESKKVDNLVYGKIFTDDKNDVYINNEIKSITDNVKFVSENERHIERVSFSSQNENIKDKSKNVFTLSKSINSYEKVQYIKGFNQLYNENEDFLSKPDNMNEASNLKVVETKYLTFGKDKTRNFFTTKTSGHNREAHHWSPFAKLKKTSRVKRQDLTLEENICEKFTYADKKTKLEHPHNTTAKENNYYSDVDCTTVIQAAEGQVIRLTFVDVFHIEEHPNCQYDYLEIRDGKYGYAKSLGRYCGSVFPSPLSSSGPFLWLKFKSDETIEYEGFTIKIEFVDAVSHSVPESCYMKLSGVSGVLGTHTIDPSCIEKSAGHALDVLWTIETDSDKYLYLNFTNYELAQPNECEMNLIQVFGAILEEEDECAHYCGSVANSVNTKNSDNKLQERGNIMYVHLLVATTAIEDTKFNATFTAFRALDPSKDEQCLPIDQEFNCEDNTCIAAKLKCDGYAHCRLKADEDPETCEHHTESTLSQPHILVILVIFSLILSGMSFVFLFKCIRKLYQDHKIIKEHIRQSCEDRLDDILADSRFTLDAKRLQRDSEPRASLERENHANELFKQQRSISQHKQTSIESDFQETHLDLDEEPWQRKVDSVPEPQDLKLERNGRTRRDTSKKEETMRSRKESVEEKKEIKDAAVGAPDTKESGCQTRESLFQADPAPSSDGSNSASNSRGFSTFGYSGATLVRPSPPATTASTPPSSTSAPKFSSTQIELLRQIPSYESKKKLPDRRPMSAETTRSAPDVIIVSKPIR